MTVLIIIAALCAIMGIVVLMGKGDKLIAGYNTASREEKAQTNEKKLLKAMSVLMFVLAGCFLVSASSELFHIKILVWIGQALFVVVLIAGLVYLNTGNRFKK